MRYTLTPLLILTLASTFLPSFGQEWWDTRFVISMMYDPPLTDRNTLRARYQDAIDAGFNLFGGDWEEHNDCKQIVLYGLVRDTLRCPNSVFFFAPRWENVPLNNYDGKLVCDEPEKNAQDSCKVACLARAFAE